MTDKETILREFQVDNCRVCIDIKDWRKRAQKAAFAESNDLSANETSSTSNSENVLRIKPLPCPPDAVGLGRATWTFLHTLSVYYPSRPTEQEQHEMQTFMGLFAKYYPCGYCAAHLRQEMVRDPPDVSSRAGFAAWMCRMHNEVNMRLGKETFDCGRVYERWRDGPPDAAKYACQEE